MARVVEGWRAGWAEGRVVLGETARHSPPTRLELRAALLALEGRGVAFDWGVSHLAATHSAAAAAVNAARTQ